MMTAVPEEVADALAAYERAHEQIRDRVEANRRRYRGTKYEDCPPLLPEELDFMVRRADVLEEHWRLEERHGPCPRRWAFAVVWFQDRTRDQARSKSATRKREVPNKAAPRDAKKRRA
jgi:hypothetical protein